MAPASTWLIAWRRKASSSLVRVPHPFPLPPPYNILYFLTSLPDEGFDVHFVYSSDSYVYSLYSVFTFVVCWHWTLIFLLPGAPRRLVKMAAQPWSPCTAMSRSRATGPWSCRHLVRMARATVATTTLCGMLARPAPYARKRTTRPCLASAMMAYRWSTASQPGEREEQCAWVGGASSDIKIVGEAYWGDQDQEGCISLWRAQWIESCCSHCIFLEDSKKSEYSQKCTIKWPLWVSPYPSGSLHHPPLRSLLLSLRLQLAIIVWVVPVVVGVAIILIITLVYCWMKNKR